MIITIIVWCKNTPKADRFLKPKIDEHKVKIKTIKVE